MISEASIKSAIRAAPTSGKKVIELKDDGPRGEGRLALIIRVATGRVASEWYAVWYKGKARATAKIGAYPTMSLGEARKLFAADYAPVIARGENPEGPRARRLRQGVTVTDLFKAYVASLRAAGVVSADKVERILLTGGKKGAVSAAKAIGEDTRAADVTSADIIPHLAKIHTRGAATMAHLTRAYVGSAFAFAMASENSYTSPGGGAAWGVKVNPVTAIPVDPTAKRVGERHLNAAEFRQFWLWLEGRDQVNVVAPALRLMLCTGQRVSEILRITADGYDSTMGMLDWGKTKNGKPHNVPLPEQGSAILDAIVPNRQGFYFPSPRNPLTPGCADLAASLVLVYLEEHPDVPSFTPRDIRRTWKTLAGAAGLSKEIRDRLQNHARSDVSSRHYDRWEMLPERRAAMKVWSDYLARILAGEFEKNVVKIGKTTAG